MAPPKPTFPERARGVVERFSFRNLTLAVCAAALLAGLAAAAMLQAPERYESVTVMIIDNPLALATAGDDSTIAKLDRLRGKYSTLAGTEAIAAPVADALGISPRAVLASTEVVATTSTLSLAVIADADTPEVAMERSAAMAQGIIDYVAREHEANAVPPGDRFVFQVVQPGRVAAKTSPTSDAALETAAVAFAVALVASYVVLQLVRSPVGVPADPGRMRDDRR